MVEATNAARARRTRGETGLRRFFDDVFCALPLREAALCEPLLADEPADEAWPAFGLDAALCDADRGDLEGVWVSDCPEAEDEDGED